MAAKNRWTPLKKFPLSQALHKCLPKAKASVKNSSHIVSESLCDDVLQRISPFLLRNPPIDVLDLWPGPGLLSSKVNDFLKPRRHVLIQPDANFFTPLLDLAKSRSCYKLLSKDPVEIVDWQPFLAEHFPEQGPLNRDPTGGMSRNDALLVLAHPPRASTTRDHFTGARWWSFFVDMCIRQHGLHAYGSVRLLASMSSADSPVILSPTINSRGRPAVVAEQTALHAFEVAAPKDEEAGLWAFWKQWDNLTNGAARVAQRASEKGVIVPVDRAYPPVDPAPPSPFPGRKPLPYAARPKTPQHEKYLQAFELFDQTKPGSPEYKEIKQQRNRAATQLTQENRQVHTRNILAAKQAQIDDLNRSIARLAADPKTELATIESVVMEIETIRAALDKEASLHHFDITRAFNGLVDDRRASFHTGNFDDALLPWDRRPFEPLLVHPGEFYPRDAERTLFYFEADPNNPATRRLARLTPEQKEAAFRFFDAYSLSLMSNNALSIPRIIELVFQNRSTNDMVKAVPYLAQHAMKRPKPNFDSLPKTLHYNPENLRDPSSPPDPDLCYQENLDYDLSDVRGRLLTPDAIWDLCVEYAKTNLDQTPSQLSRLLGGTMTAAQSREFAHDRGKKYH
ncbi:hypothetical protein BDW59DRAFT_2844 [Aspergillus cavernicola]|uniref:rRNA adenine N(6)-methyltransferase n=1 Tax=Aspergillus cavernicola TaxID=176166 RepID=A0ABR4J4U8_9EURO